VARNIAFSSALIVGLAAASPGDAEPLNDFGTRGSLILSADRLSPLLSYTRVRQDQQGGDYTTTSTTSMSLLWSGAVQDFYDIPRAGLDYVLAPNVTLGGMLFATLPLSATRADTQNGTTTSRDTGKISALGIGARAGYIVPLSPRLSLWARGGLSYTRVSMSSTQGNMMMTMSTVALSQTALSLEPLFVISVTSHFGVQLGPVVDLPLSGSQHTEDTTNGMTVSQDNSASQLHIGITAGLLGWL
jgi:opacity protein-like surface antigen